jgi:uncharacterized protein with PIN domain
MEKRVILDTTLVRLAKWLRIIGMDSVLFTGTDLHRLIQISQEQKRIILTRNRKLEPKRFLGNIIILKENQPDRQIGEVLEALQLKVDWTRFLSRCLLCNAEIEAIPRETAEGEVPEFVFHIYQEFHRCPACHKIYWKGTHPNNMKKRIEGVLRARDPNGPGKLQR